MKRALKLSTLVLVLGMATSVYAEQAESHAEGDAPVAAEAPTPRRELRDKDLPADLKQYPQITKGKAEEVTVSVLVSKANEATDKTVSKESFEKLQAIVKDNAKFRAEIADCEGDSDKGKAQLSKLMDQFHDQLAAALFEKTDLAGVTAKRAADEKALVTSVSQILSLLLVRGEKLTSIEHAPYSSALEKKVAVSLKQTLNLILGDEVKAEDRLTQFDEIAQLGDKRFEDSVKATKEAILQVKLSDEQDLCLMGAPKKNKTEPLRTEVVKNEPKNETTPKIGPIDNRKEPTPPAPPVTKTEPTLTTIQDAFEARFAQMQADFNKGVDAFLAQSEQIAKQRAKEAEIAKLDDNKKQEEYLKALLGNKKDEQKAMQNPQPPVAQAAPAGGGGQPQQQQQDPMQQQQQQQDPGAQQNQMAQAMMQQMMMQQMMNPQQTQSVQPIYQTGPSNRWDDIFNSRSSRTSTTAIPAADPAKGGYIAQQELLAEIRRAGQQQQMGAPNAYGQQQPYYGPQQSYGPQQQQPYGGGIMSNRLFSQQAPTRRNQVNTSGFSGLSAISGPQQLAGSPLGRTSTIPLDLTPGGIASGTGAGLAF